MICDVSRWLLAGLALAWLAACSDDTGAGEQPPPHAITEEAVGYFCSMNLLEHSGPKGQVLVPGEDRPVWFSTVRQTVAYTMLPESPRVLSAVYVSDLSAVEDWRRVNPDAWVEARSAWFVVESEATGGMGGEDPMPFSDRSKAEQFAQRHGGRVLAFDALTEDYILYADSLFETRPGGTSQAVGEAGTMTEHM
ncbi:copper resistance protein CopZ [Corticimicrobacter populi]|uniref:Copper resistance protein CopZ n=2 Tax=Corticimicrobacter populi TaxID=2175229 RepID=A0A2V1JXJ0_9BURK|nr:copper resistance protein CopZ [Corticimicrobacter populi]